MPNAVAMTKSVGAGMNLWRSTGGTIRASAGAGQDGPTKGPPFITVERLFITAIGITVIGTPKGVPYE